MAERTCAGCRAVHAKTELIRYVCAPDGRLLVDYRSKLPGRGAYTCIDRECIASAVKQNGFSRAFKKPISVADPDALLQELVQSLNVRILNLIGVARKAGAVVSGSNSVLQELGKPTAYLLIVANDAAAGTADKILNKAKGCEVPDVKMFDKRILGSTVGKDERSHVVVTNKKFAKNLILEIDRLKKIAGEN